MLLANDGNGRFEDVSAAAGVGGDDEGGMSAAWGDFDDDRLLDLYVTNYMSCSGPWTTEAEVIANVAYDDDVLYRNQGDGTFEDVTDLLPESRGRPPASPPPGSMSTRTGGRTCTSATTSSASRPSRTDCGATRGPARTAGRSPTCRWSRVPGST